MFINKKQGFTLAEVLITLGIIGIITALIMPAINHLKPDENKVIYLKVYDTLADTIKDLATNSRIYPACENENNINCSENPLFNTEKPLIEPFNTDAYQGATKLCNLLAFALGDNNPNCKAENYTYSNDTFKNNISFVTSNGMQWIVSQRRSITTNGSSATFQADIYVDINGNKGSNAIYSADNDKPDIFKFMVAANGTVVPADPAGRAYIASRKSLLKKNVTISDSEVLTDLNSNMLTFAYSPCQVEVVVPETPSTPPVTPDPPETDPTEPSTPEIIPACGGTNRHLYVYGMSSQKDGKAQVADITYNDLYNQNATVLLYFTENKTKIDIEWLYPNYAKEIEDLTKCVTRSLEYNPNLNKTLLETARKNAFKKISVIKTEGKNYANDMTKMPYTKEELAKFATKDLQAGKYGGSVAYFNYGRMFDSYSYTQACMITYRKVVDTITSEYNKL